MLTELLSEKEFGFNWIDVASPDEEELLEVGLMFELPLKPVRDCMDFAHLPKYEEHGFTRFVLIRGLYYQELNKSCSLEDITRKVAIFWNSTSLITIHRMGDDFITSIKEGFLYEHKRTPNPINSEQINNSNITNINGKESNNTQSINRAQLEIFNRIMRKVIESYDAPMDYFEELFEKYEDEVFGQKENRAVIGETYFLKRQLSVYRRMLRLTLDAIRKVELNFHGELSTLEYLRADGERMVTLADAAIDNIHNLLNLHVSFQNSHTNEIVRILTIFSAFFMPLTFIAGLYGMNFESMPELKSPLGYPLTLAFMGLVCLLIYIWFRKKNWIGDNSNSEHSSGADKFETKLSYEEKTLPNENFDSTKVA